MSIYKNVQRLCKENNITISKLENELEFSRGSIYKWDSNTPSIAKVKKVAEFFGVLIEDLLKEIA